jgi:cell division initiation protein
MALTPVEIRHVRLGRRIFGYRRTATDSLLEEVATSFEDVWRERADLTDKVEQLEGDLVRYRELESLLRATLVSAERTAAELKDQARREADLIVGEAHSEARAITRQAIGDNERLQADSSRVRALLQAALATIEAHAPEELGGDEAPEAEAA